MINNKVRITSFILLVVTIVVALYSNISMKLTKQSFEDMEKAFMSYKEAYSCVSSFEEGSEYLSDNIRRYVINMNKDYVDNYFREADLLKRRESAIERLHTFSETNQLEMQLFDEAMELSKELEQIDLHAMALLYEISPYDNPNEKVLNYKLSDLEKSMSSYNKQELAYSLIFSNEYNDKRNIITEKVKIGKNLIADNNIDINSKSVSKAEAAIEMLNIYWGMFVAVAVGALLFMNIYQFVLLFKKKKYSEKINSDN